MSSGLIGVSKSSRSVVTFSLSCLFIAWSGRRKFSNESAGGPRSVLKFAAIVNYPLHQFSNFKRIMFENSSIFHNPRVGFRTEQFSF